MNSSSGFVAAPIGGNATTNKIYVLLYPGPIAVIDEARLKVSSVPVGGNTSFVTVDASANQIYVVNLLFLPSASYSTVMVIDGATNSTTTLNVGVEPRAAAVNAATHRVYVLNDYGNDLSYSGPGPAPQATVSVIEGAH